METKNIKLNSEVYIFVMNPEDGGANIVKGRVCGCRETLEAVGKYKFIIETPCGYYERFAIDMYETIDAMKESLENLVLCFGF